MGVPPATKGCPYSTRITHRKDGQIAPQRRISRAGDGSRLIRLSEYVRNPERHPDSHHPAGRYMSLPWDHILFHKANSDNRQTFPYNPFKQLNYSPRSPRMYGIPSAAGAPIRLRMRFIGTDDQNDDRKCIREHLQEKPRYGL